MKNLFKSMMAIAVAAMSFTACSNDLTEDVTPSQEFTVKINAVSPESRTVFGDIDDGKYPTLWTGNESIKAALNVSTAQSVNVAEVSNGGASATFEDVTFTDDASGSYTIYAVSPASAANGLDTQYKSWTIVVPTEQTPTATSCDPAAQILVGKSATTNTVPSEVTMNFNHFTAYAKINFTNVALNGAVVESINISSDGKIAGQFYNYPTQDKANYTNYAKTSITVDTKYITVDTNSLANVWVALAPTKVSKLTFTINTDQGTITKAVTGLNKEFKSGVVATFNVDMTGKTIEKGDKYTLVTDLSVLAEGDNVIIAAANNNYAISIDNTANNRPATEITKVDNTITPTSLVGIFTIHDAEGKNLYAFKDTTDDKFLYAASSSSNHLKTQETNNENGCWDINIDSATGAAVIVAQGDKTRNVMQYNYYDTIFSCYDSAKYDNVALYYKSNGGEKIAIEPQIKVSNVTNVAYSGVTDATLDIIIRNISGEITVTPDGTVVEAASVSGNVLTYTVAANDGAAREGSIVLRGDSVEETITVSQLAKPADGANDGSSIEKAYTVAEAIALHKSGSAPTDPVWVVGPIAGYYKSGTGLVTDLTNAVATNLAIGTSGECIPVELPSGAIRTAINLQDNPSNLGKVVYLKGKIKAYFTVAGLRSTSAYQFAE